MYEYVGNTPYNLKRKSASLARVKLARGKKVSVRHIVVAAYCCFCKFQCTKNYGSEEQRCSRRAIGGYFANCLLSLPLCSRDPFVSIVPHLIPMRLDSLTAFPNVRNCSHT